MSVVDTVQRLFKTKSVPLEDSMDLASVGMPGDILAAEAMGGASLHTATLIRPDARAGAFAPSRIAQLEEEDRKSVV